MKDSALERPKQDPPPDILSFKVFRLFEVTATGRAIDLVSKILPLLIFAAFGSALIFCGAFALFKFLGS